MGLSLSKRRRRRRSNQDHHNQSPISIPTPSSPSILQPQSLPVPPPSNPFNSQPQSLSSSPSSTISDSSSTTLQILPPPPLPPLFPPPPPPPPPPPLRRRSSPLPPPPPPPLLNLQRSFLSPPSPYDYFFMTSPPPPPHPSSLWSSLPSSPPPPPPSYLYAVNASYPADLSLFPSNSCSHTPVPMVVLANPRNGSTAVHSLMRPSQSRPPYVTAEKINNDVIVHKDSIKLNMDTNDLGSFLVSFTFDALVDGCITILYFAKEEENCTFTPLYAECCMPGRFPFQKGLSQKFFQPSGTGIDLGFFAIDELSSFNPEEGIFPLVIRAETCLAPLSVSVDAESIQPLSSMPAHAQVTQAVLEKNNQGQFEARVIEQILWVDGVSYELLELYGIGNSGEADVDGSEPGKECVICMAEQKDTAVLPCRHVCMCRHCSEELRIQSNKCPICRQRIEELVVIKADEGDFY
ncbi:hypothetical protein FNV43_RR04883 [Rhamnella rubrinervis]|uniref:RING-type E3 ubiquitin transferase n=1 Tax=Rhamnella rubrinervis TaxID=2594499 RepID=A0A8K0HL30_9ROSA|nr:hypothetical protein FNV43_RR04883 [Rhamnella rubrinervis]